MENPNFSLIFRSPGCEGHEFPIYTSLGAKTVLATLEIQDFHDPLSCNYQVALLIACTLSPRK